MICNQMDVLQVVDNGPTPPDVQAIADDNAGSSSAVWQSCLCTMPTSTTALNFQPFV